MNLAWPVARWGGARLARRLAVSVPYFGAAIALVTLGAAIRRKGVVRGSVDTGLNAIPFVGAAKNVVELWRGKDLLDDRPRSGPGGPPAAGPSGRPAGGPPRRTVSSRLKEVRL